jgi:hypothetical protein
VVAEAALVGILAPLELVVQAMQELRIGVNNGKTLRIY